MKRRSDALDISRARIRLLDPQAQHVEPCRRVVGIEARREIAHHLGNGAAGGREHRLSVEKRFDDGKAEAFVLRGIEAEGGVPVERCDLVIVGVGQDFEGAGETRIAAQVRDEVVDQPADPSRRRRA